MMNKYLFYNNNREQSEREAMSCQLKLRICGGDWRRRRRRRRLSRSVYLDKIFGFPALYFLIKKWEVL